MNNKKIRLLGIIAITFTSLIGSVSASSINRVFDKSYITRNNHERSVAQKVDKLLKNNESDSYASYYGGMYISDDSSNLIVQIVRDEIPTQSSTYSLKKAEEIQTYNKIKNIDKTIKFEYVDNSYEELNNVNDQIINYFSSDNYEYDNLNGNFVDTINNVVVVELKENNNEQQNKFKEFVIDSDLIVFKEAEQENYDFATLKAGQGITTKGVPNNCSLGWRVKVGSNAGYITAGHCVNGLNDTLPTGTVKKYQQSGKVDAAFVQTNSSYSVSNSLYYPYGSINILNVTLCPYLTVNTVIGKNGVTTQYTSGKIKSLNYSGTYSGKYFTNLIATDAHASGGDSGGAVFTTSLVDGTAPVAGIVKGSSSYGMAFVNADEIFLSFRYSRY